MYAQAFSEFCSGFPSVRFLMIWAGLSVHWVLMWLTEHSSSGAPVGLLQRILGNKSADEGYPKKTKWERGVGHGWVCVFMCVTGCVYGWEKDTRLVMLAEKSTLCSVILRWLQTRLQTTCLMKVRQWCKRRHVQTCNMWRVGLIIW